MTKETIRKTSHNAKIAVIEKKAAIFYAVINKAKKHKLI